MVSKGVFMCVQVSVQKVGDGMSQGVGNFKHFIEINEKNLPVHDWKTSDTIVM